MGGDGEGWKVKSYKIGRGGGRDRNNKYNNETRRENLYQKQGKWTV